jgi:uncharacterized protein YdiU (UPF0061 family)
MRRHSAELAQSSSVVENGLTFYGLTPSAGALLDPKEDRAVEIATKALGEFTRSYQHHWLEGMRRKLGLFATEPDDLAFIETLLAWMHKTKADFTNTFAVLTHTLPTDDQRRDDEGFLHWHERWLARLRQQSQSLAESEQLRRAHNPVFIPRNHLVEAALAAAEHHDFSVMERLLAVLATPYDYARDAAEYRQPAPEGDEHYQTFCGT